MSTTGRDFDDRARAAAAGLRRAVTVEGPEVGQLVRAARVRRAGRLIVVVAVAVALGAIGFAASSVAVSDDLRWATGAVLVALVVVTGALCAHAGGHAWFVPLPALALGVLWLATGSSDQAAGWWLVATCAAASAVGVVVAGTALRQRLRSSWGGLSPLLHATGAAVTPLDPAGVVRVNSEHWTAVSLSGPLPAGAPVHVASVRGVRLEVWSEEGTVPGVEAIEPEEDQP